MGIGPVSRPHRGPAPSRWNAISELLTSRGDAAMG